MKKVIFLIFVSLGISYSTFAQQEDEQAIEDTEKRSDFQIERLKNGVLLVRLFYKEKSIEYLKSAGKMKAAIDYETKIEEENLELIRAFKENFTFCPVYFFDSKYSDNVLKRNFEDIIFLDVNGNENKDITMNSTYFYTAEISATLVDTNVRKSEIYPQINQMDQEILGIKKTLFNTFQALRIKSDKFVDLLPPFPNAVRTFKNLPLIKRSYKTIVKRLNNKLKRNFKE